jgi:transposase InsO family protein
MNDLITGPYKSRRQRTFIRFQRAHPNSLWQTDTKYHGDHYLIAYLDDSSRYVPALELFEEATTDSVLHLLDDALCNGRVPNQMLSDHGTQYWSNDGDSRFTDFCEKHGIEHIMSSIEEPTTQGKKEQFFQTFERYYARFNDSNRFRECYNNKPHGSLNCNTPSPNILQLTVRNVIGCSSAEANECAFDMYLGVM